jgi:hypothetical protein
LAEPAPAKPTFPSPWEPAWSIGARGFGSITPSI